MADTLLILRIPTFQSLWLIPISMLSFSAKLSSCSWAAQDLVWLFTTGLLINAPKASCMMCPIQGRWFLNAGHSIPESSSVDFHLLSYWVIWWSIISCNAKQTANGQLKTVMHILQMYGYPCCSMLAIDLSSLICFWNWKRTGDQPHQMPVELYPMPNCNSDRTQWATLSLVNSLMSIRSKQTHLIWWSQLLPNCIHGQCIYHPTSVVTGCSA